MDGIQLLDAYNINYDRVFNCEKAFLGFQARRSSVTGWLIVVAPSGRVDHFILQWFLLSSCLALGLLFVWFMVYIADQYSTELQ